jgi:acyl-CoA reductase-like NAD-dependent aldehyde dehydrogenase
MASASKSLKRVTLELGGKDPAIVCEDVDVEDVAQKVTKNCPYLANANQTIGGKFGVLKFGPS